MTDEERLVEVFWKVSILRRYVRLLETIHLQVIDGILLFIG
jgi:hypothetical protein